MTDKSFRFDWYPKDAHADFMQLTAEQIGVLMQVCNLIYINNGPIAYDGKWISQSIYSMGTAKCNRILRELLEKRVLVSVENGTKITQKRSENEMKLTRNRREFRSEMGKKGAKTRYEIEENQPLEKKSAIASTRHQTPEPDTRTNKPPTPFENSEPKMQDEFVGKDMVEGVLKNGVGKGVFGDSYQIQNFLSEDGWMDARSHAPGWDINQLASVYNEGIKNGKRQPPKYPDKAFPIWCRSYTKGKPML